MKCYVESDGRVFLVRRDGLLDLPTADELPFSIERIAPLAAGSETWFCIPVLAEHPHAWPSKDEIPLLPDVTSAVRAAVHASMPRIVVEGVCIERGKVLLVRGSRGLNEGRWSLPGGFLRFGETPEEGVLREIEEEVGAPAALVRPAGMHARYGTRSHLHWVMFFYRAALRGEPHPNPDEIAEARFVDVAEASVLLHDEAMVDAVRRENSIPLL